MIAQADAVQIPLADKSIHCCVTSPPYWGLRKYAGNQGDEPLGLEPTPERHVERIVEICREVRRVLRDDGTLWLNYGDSYSSGARGGDSGRKAIRDCQDCDCSSSDPYDEHEGLIQNRNVDIDDYPDSVQSRADHGPNPAHRESERGRPASSGSDRRVDHSSDAIQDQMLSSEPIDSSPDALQESNEQPSSSEFLLSDANPSPAADDQVSPPTFDVGVPLSEDIALDLDADRTASAAILDQHSDSECSVATDGALVHRRGDTASCFCPCHNYTKTPRQGSLMMMPHRVALALQADGWIVRQDLVWFKRNPMPESVNGWRWQRERARTDGEWTRQEIANREDGHSGHISNRPKTEYEYGDDLELKRGSWRHTRAHEYVFMLTKKMQYWSNQEAVREIGTSGPSDIRKMEQGLDRIGGKTLTAADPLYKANQDTHIGQKRGVGDPSGRNPRSVLDVPTQPYKGAHYATFPPNLIAPLIRATCPRRCCPVCGQGWAAVVEKSGGTTGQSWHDHSDDEGRGNFKVESSEGYQVKSLGYKPTCEHDEEPVPGIVFDPFVGSGTTIAVAKSLLRRGVGIDISMEYLDEQAKVRAGLGTPSKALEDLPLFSGKDPAPPLNKQDSLGKSTYTGFNARWKEKHQ